LKQVALAQSGAARQAEPSIADGYESAVSRLQQPQRHLRDDEISLLVASYRSGSTIAELAAQLECDRKTVMRYLKLQCVEMRIRRLTEVQIDEAVRLYESGMSLAKVGRLIGAVPKTVRSRLLERGVQLRTLSTRT
jgi:predicted HTH domain antitoxin